MKITLRDIYLARDSFDKIFSGTQFDSTMTYRWAKSKLAMDEELKIFYIARLQILKPFETEDGNFTIPPESQTKITQDIENLLQIEVDIPDFDLSVAQISSVNGISVMDWIRLNPFIEKRGTT